MTTDGLISGPAADFGPVVTTPEQRHKAALYVAGHADGVEDATLLLEALGLREGAQ